MAISVASLSSSFTSLPFTSQKPYVSSLPHSKLQFSSSLTRKFSTFIVSASKSKKNQLADSVDEPVYQYESKKKFTNIEDMEEMTVDPEMPPVELIPRDEVLKIVKSRLPGGFAAQPIHGTGRRKSASARVVLQEGSGKAFINYRDARDYLQGNPLWLQYVRAPLTLLGYETSYDVFVKVQGGGLSGQAQAICLGVARALLKVSEIHRPPLRQEGLLTRDSRVVERKKVGLRKARKRPQYSKR